MYSLHFEGLAISWCFQVVEGLLGMFIMLFDVCAEEDDIDKVYYYTLTKEVLKDF